MKVLLLMFVAFLNACDCVPAKWFHNQERCVGLYVRDKKWKGGGYMTWKRCDEKGVRYWDCIPVSMATEIELLNVDNELVVD